jgi:hypothetical protein
MSYWQEKASWKPPPPDGVPEVEAPEVSVRIAPALTLLAAVAEQDEPAAASVEQVTTELPAVPVLGETDGVTLNSVHVVATPE